jgi:hypothetical protein
LNAGFNEKDVEAAEREEEEARVIQKRLVEQLDEGDFLLDVFSKVFCCSSLSVSDGIACNFSSQALVTNNYIFFPQSHLLHG